MLQLWFTNQFIEGVVPALDVHIEETIRFGFDESSQDRPKYKIRHRGYLICLTAANALRFVLSKAPVDLIY